MERSMLRRGKVLMGKRRRREECEQHHLAGAAAPRVQRYSRAPPDDYRDVSEEWFWCHNGLRYVKPYRFEFRVNCKQRWVGSTLLQAFSGEFRHRSETYWRTEIDSARLLVNGGTACAESVINGSESFTHVVHRHESTVLDKRPTIVFHDDSVLAVDKPASMPVHPCGSFRRNSLLCLLAMQARVGELFPVHRLDRVTSGVVLFGKSKNVASALAKSIERHEVTKRYLARVEGEFPGAATSCNAALVHDKKTHVGECRVDGKDALTEFDRLWYDEHSHTSLVLCVPRTGRTHQIRIHLRHLGHPINNDPLYCDNFRRQTGAATATLHPTVSAIGADVLEQGTLLGCVTCPAIVAKDEGDSNVYEIHLHALRYEAAAWRYDAPPPPWATPSASMHLSELGKTVFSAEQPLED